MEPYISVIIVTYNYAKYLPRALNACLNQTFKDFEIVIVNNGSTDNTGEVIDKFCSAHPELNINVKVIEKNIGLPNGRNIGLDAATGAYIMFNDADDWMENNCLEIFAAITKRTNADKVRGAYNVIDINGKIGEYIYKKDISQWLTGEFQGVIFKKNILTENNIIIPLDIKAEDYFFNFEFNKYSKTNIICKNIIYNHYIHHKSTSRKISSVTILKDLLNIYMPYY